MFTLFEIPYSLDALEPHISRETMEYHYKKHNQAYVDNLNKLIVDTEFENMSLEEIIIKSSGAIFNNAAQIWNHIFYFEGFSWEKTHAVASTELHNAIEKTWGDESIFIEEFNKMALSNFGSGWTWLVKNTKNNTLEIINTPNGENPLTDPELKPLIGCDVWEHAYYIDRRNARAEYLNHFWQIIDWEKISERYAQIR